MRELADFCIVDVVDDRGEIRRLKVVSRDPARGWIGALLEQVPLDRARPHLSRRAVQAGRTDLMRQLTPEATAALAQSAQHLEAARS